MIGLIAIFTSFSLLYTCLFKYKDFYFYLDLNEISPNLKDFYEKITGEKIKHEFSNMNFFIILLNSICLGWVLSAIFIIIIVIIKNYV